MTWWFLLSDQVTVILILLIYLALLQIDKEWYVGVVNQVRSSKLLLSHAILSTLESCASASSFLMSLHA